MTLARRLILVRRPGVSLDRADTQVIEADVPVVSEGTFLVSVSHVTLEVSMIGWMREGRSYLPNISLGDTVRATGVGRVTASRHPEYSEGDLVTGLFGAQTHALSDGAGVVKLNDAAASAEAWAGSLGLTTAFTSHVGLAMAPTDLTGKTALVSGVSGLVGGFAAQIARQRGARVIGIAGGPQNCELAVSKLGLDQCLDYLDDSFEQSLHAACPGRIDVFFDVAGGSIFDIALGWMNAFGTVIMCGQTAERGASQPVPVTNIRSVIMERLTLRGFVVLDHPDLYPKAASDIAEGISEGTLQQVYPDVSYDGGLAAFHDAYEALVQENRRGKHVLRL